MSRIEVNRFIITPFIGLVWFINGLFCKILNFTPRHQQIVARILGDTNAIELTKAIGIAEVLMVIWIFTGIKSKWCALFQMFIIAVMNIIEFIYAPDLLLFGKINIILAFCFIVIIYVNEFILKRDHSS
jgi:uncharacterized membrane protein YphA (DoxX/SURF4 family)